MSIKLIQVRPAGERALISCDVLSYEEFYLPSWSDKQDHFSFGHISSLRYATYISQFVTRVSRRSFHSLNWLIMLRLSNADAKFICYFMLISFHFIWRTHESQTRVIYDTGIKLNENSRIANKARLSFIPSFFNALKILATCYGISFYRFRLKFKLSLRYYVIILYLHN